MLLSDPERIPPLTPVPPVLRQTHPPDTLDAKQDATISMMYREDQHDVPVHTDTVPASVVSDDAQLSLTPRPERNWHAFVMSMSRKHKNGGVSPPAW